MKSKTSFFDLTVLRKNITRFAPVWALYLVGGILIGLSSMPQYDIECGYGAWELGSSIGSMAVVNFLYAIVTAQMLFGDLFNSRLCNALHALPLRREGWFLTHTAAGLLFSLVPNLILSLCFLPYLGQMWYISLIWLFGMTLEYLFFFGLAALSAMCTGNRFAMAAVYAIINFLSMIAYWFVDTFYAPLLYGLCIREDGFLQFCPLVQVAGNTELVIFHRQRIQATPHGYNRYSFHYEYGGLSSDWWYLAALAVLGVGLLGAAVLLYRRRKLESAGDFAAFRWLKPIFSVIFTLSVGAIFEMISASFMGLDHVFLIVGIVVGYFVTQMLLQRTVRVFRWKAFGACAVIGGTLLLSIVLTALDPLGVTRWTPDPENVEQIMVSDSYYYNPEYDKAHTITNPELIQDLISIHQQLLIEETLHSNNQPHSAITLIYQMSDGRQIERRYRYVTNSQTGNRIQHIFGSLEFVLGYTDWESFLSTIARVTVEGDDMDLNRFAGTNARELLSAIRDDCKAGATLQNQNYAYQHGKITISYQDHTSHTIAIYANFKNTIAWLEAHS